MKESFAVIYKDYNVLSNSSSGGAFSLISDYVLKNSGIIYGAIYNFENNNVLHVRANNVSNRNLMRGSKYLQSKLTDTFKYVKEDLIEGKLVLFTGTICQIAGLKQFLNAKNIITENLITIDIICHGVASPLIWKQYINYKSSKKLTSLNFRSKENGWCDSKAIACNDETVIDIKEYMRLFYSHTIMRPSCHSCPFTSLKRCSEITIGDFWGIEKLNVKFDYSNGVSFVMVNNEKGKVVFNNILLNNDKIMFQKVDVSDVHQPNFYAPTKASVIRKRFWKDYRNKKIGYIIKKYASDSFFYTKILKIQKVIDYIKK